MLPCYRSTSGLKPAVGLAAEAVKDFQAVLDNRGAEPFSTALPLAQLGRARALNQLGDSAGSASAYAELMTIWETADDDIPVVKQARSEAGLFVR